MNHILLLEDIPEIRAWLKALVLQVFPNSVITECSRVKDALGQLNNQFHPGPARSGPARWIGRRCRQGAA
jgi:hypothetical protein